MTPRRWVAAGVGGFAAVLGLALLVDLIRPLPSGWLASREHRRVLDRHGVVLAERPVPFRGHQLWVELDQIAPAVVDAVLAAEDDRFRDHVGVDLWAVLRAVRANARGGTVVQGASTISQQTARMVAGRGPGGLGKIGEAWTALKLEVHLGKDEILTRYLNQAYFGAGAYGIEAAARTTFDESASSLSVSEAATLVGLLPAPSRRHPGVDGRAAERARNRVLDRMVATGRLTSQEAGLARDEPLQLRSRRPEGLAPHFVARQLDAQGAPAEIRTTLDADLQRDVEGLVAEQIGALAGRDVDHAAVIVVHVPSGEVRAYVGSADFEASDGQVDGVRALRSPGSALKPFVYGVAFAQGWRPADVIDDAPMRFATRHGTWAPVNYDGRFRGAVRLREALAGSYNLPAVVLLDDIGVATLQSRLDGIGVALPHAASHYGLGLALGDGGVTLEALTAAYAGLARGANGGHWPMGRRPAAKAVDASSTRYRPGSSPTCWLTRWPACRRSAAAPRSPAATRPASRRAHPPTTGTIGPSATPRHGRWGCGLATSTGAPWETLAG